MRRAVKQVHTHSRAVRLRGYGLLLALCLGLALNGMSGTFLSGAFLSAKGASPVTSQAATGDATQAPGPAERGKQSFVSRCGRCHGVDGRGGEHAPNIATNPRVQDMTDAELDRLIRNGLPAQGMPAFSTLGPAEIKAVIAYLRVLQGQQAAPVVNGNPARGKGLFFGSAGCSGCHMVHGEGGFMGPDLSRCARARSPAEIREAIVNPGAASDSGSSVVAVTGRDGGTLTGIVRNEDNFSLQLQTPDGAFHLPMKSDLASLRREPRSFMPSDYGTRLSAADVTDLVSFIVNIGGATGNRVAPEGRSGP
jgi:cytochrome c oxidase cbb3-type subunit III